MIRRNPWRRIRHLLIVSDTEPIRFFIAVSSLLWGLLLMLPGETFERQTYAVMEQIAAESIWAFAHVVHGVAALWALITGRKGRLTWILDPLIGCLLWTSSSVAMLMSVSPVPAAIAPHLVGSVAAWWLLVRHDGRSRD